MYPQTFTKRGVTVGDYGQFCDDSRVSESMSVMGILIAEMH